MAIKVPSIFWNVPPPRSIMSGSLKRRCRKVPVSSGTDGPPMFIMSMPVFTRGEEEEEAGVGVAAAAVVEEADMALVHSMRRESARRDVESSMGGVTAVKES